MHTPSTVPCGTVRRRWLRHVHVGSGHVCTGLVRTGLVRTGLAVVFLLLLLRPAAAVIQVLLPLQAVLDDSQYIVLANVQQVDAEKPSAILQVTQSYKGKFSQARLPVNLTGDKERHTPRLLKRIAPGIPVVLFIKEEANGRYMALGFTNGTWFQLLGTTDSGQTRWAFTHCEIYLRRTFKGTTEELQSVVTDVLTGKRQAPPPSPKEKAGFGPELAAG